MSRIEGVDIVESLLANNNKQNMNTFDFDSEWEFIISEIHAEKPRKDNLLKREILFSLQILLSKTERKNYFLLKKIYYREKYSIN